MFPSQGQYSFAEFYEGLQNIQSSGDHYEYGKVADFSKTTKGFKKITSVQSFSMGQPVKGPKKSSSTATFHQNDYEMGYYGKSVSNFVYHEESTKETYSPYSSATSMSSVNSMAAAQANGKIKAPGKKKPPSEMDFRNKYKTEVCKYWAENGYCEFGDQCAFAHGGNEVRQKAFVASNYKTKQCEPYHETGYCVYGVRCQFLHCLRKDCSYNPRLQLASYQDDLESTDIWMTQNQDCLCLRRKDRPRLPIFQKLALAK